MWCNVLLILFFLRRVQEKYQWIQSQFKIMNTELTILEFCFAKDWTNLNRMTKPLTNIIKLSNLVPTSTCN